MAERAPRTWPALDLTLQTGADVAPDRRFPLVDRLAVALDDLGALAVDDATPGRWRIYLADDGARETAEAALRTRLGAFITVARVDVPDEGWAVKVQQALGAVQIGRIVVSPPWESRSPAAGGADVAIVIEPSTGFGTGHHQSTRLCLQVLQDLPLAGRRVLDVGTGSGVLAIAAAKLGAASVAAIDSDEDAVRAAVENAARNGVGVSATLADLETLAIPPADVVLANLTAITLRRLRVELMRLVAESGVLVVSGFTHDQVPLVQESLAPLVVVTRVDEDDWVALALRRTAPDRG